jgi:hypothetical protein
VNGTTLNITLKAAPLGLSVSAVAADGLSITLGATATNLGTELENATIIRNRGGVSEAVTPSSTTGGVITLTAADEVKAGDIYTITVNPGDGKSPSETTTAMIGGIAFASDAYTIEYGQAGFTAPLIVYGSAPATSTYESVTAATATIGGTGEVTTVKAGTSIINLSVTQSGDGYFYTTNSQKATYNLTVDKANATIAWGTLADFTDKPITANGTIGAINEAKLYNSLSNELTQDADHGGTIAYSIVSIDGSTTSDLFTIDGNNLKVGTNALTNSKTYTIQLRATVTAGASARYDNTVADKTIKVTTVAAP